jgi:hypothetical protein
MRWLLAAGLLAAGLLTAGLLTAGLLTAGLLTAGLLTAGLLTAGLLAAGLGVVTACARGVVCGVSGDLGVFAVVGAVSAVLGGVVDVRIALVVPGAIVAPVAPSALDAGRLVAVGTTLDALAAPVVGGGGVDGVGEGVAIAPLAFFFSLIFLVWDLSSFGKWEKNSRVRIEQKMWWVLSSFLHLLCFAFAFAAGYLYARATRVNVAKYATKAAAGARTQDESRLVLAVNTPGLMATVEKSMSATQQRAFVAAILDSNFARSDVQSTAAAALARGELTNAQFASVVMDDIVEALTHSQTPAPVAGLVCALMDFIFNSGGIPDVGMVQGAGGLFLLGAVQAVRARLDPSAYAIPSAIPSAIPAAVVDVCDKCDAVVQLLGVTCNGPTPHHTCRACSPGIVCRVCGAPTKVSLTHAIMDARRTPSTGRAIK